MGHGDNKDTRFDPLLRAKVLTWLENNAFIAAALGGGSGLSKYSWSDSDEILGIEYHGFLNNTDAIIMEIGNAGNDGRYFQCTPAAYPANWLIKDTLLYTTADNIVF